jgi:hypothetical protein
MAKYIGANPRMSSGPINTKYNTDGYWYNIIWFYITLNDVSTPSMQFKYTYTGGTASFHTNFTMSNYVISV